MSKAEQHAVTEEEEKRALKKATLYPMLFHTIQGVVQHLITLQTEPILMRELCNGDVAEASRMLGSADVVHSSFLTLDRTHEPR